MALINYERETIVNFNDESKTAEIYTCNKALISRLDGYCEKFPELYKLVESDEESKTYSCPKRYVSIRKPKILTEEQKQKIRERFAKNKEN